MLYSYDESVPKLLGTLANRYSQLNGGYVRILRYGFHRPGTDRAPLAIVEFVGHEKDTVKKLAVDGGRLSEAKQQLRNVESQKYIKSGVTLVDPFTKRPEEFAILRVREDLPGYSVKKLNSRELGLQKSISRMERAVNGWEKAAQTEKDRKEQKRNQLQIKVNLLLEKESKGSRTPQPNEVYKVFQKVMDWEGFKLSNEYQVEYAQELLDAELD
ncbi:hypothetical protein HK096_003928 [Nowakowskiella sp. JEL0078]|nr:hypothetical protein HK096_003928 [Nowakowskiella sp. JEL0078]